MALTKRGKYWHYDFIYRKKRYQGSTDQTNRNKAKLVESKIRSDAALEAFGIGPPKESPPFKDFMEGRFVEFIRNHVKGKRTIGFYIERTKPLIEHFKDARLSDIDEDAIEKYKTARLKKVSRTTVNRDLSTLSRALYLAIEWKLIPRKPKVRLFPNERERDFVVSGELEKAYLAAADYPLEQAAILMLDLGLRPDECVRLKRMDIVAGVATVREGKSKNAARALPLTARALASVELLKAVRPDSEFLFPGRKKGTHLHRVSLDRMHWNLRKAQEWPAEFVLYAFRHTFGTRLAESGASPFHIRTLMGHSSINMSSKYIHPQADDVALAMKRKEAMDQLLRGEAVPVDSTTANRK